MEKSKTNLESKVKVIAVIIALAGLFWGIFEFHKSQKWQKGQLINSIIDSFESNESIQIAKTLIDYDSREVIVQDSFKFTYNSDTLVLALRVMKVDNFPKNQLIIRDALDDFFDFFHKLHSYQKMGIFEFDDFEYFFYWFDILTNLDYYKESENMQLAMDTYVDEHFFFSIRELLDEYKKLDISKLKKKSEKEKTKNNTNTNNA